MEIQLSSSAHYTLGLAPFQCAIFIHSSEYVSFHVSKLSGLALDPDTWGYTWDSVRLFCMIPSWSERNPFTHWCWTDNMHLKVISLICTELHSFILKELMYIPPLPCGLNTHTHTHAHIKDNSCASLHSFCILRNVSVGSGWWGKWGGCSKLLAFIF